MNTFTAICGHSASVVGAPGSVARAICDVTPCPACLEQIEDGDHAPFALIAKRIADQDDLIRQLSERVATCSELLSKAAERHDNAERLRQRIAELETDVAWLRREKAEVERASQELRRRFASCSVCGCDLQPDDEPVRCEGCYDSGLHDEVSDE